MLNYNQSFSNSLLGTKSFNNINYFNSDVCDKELPHFK